MNDPYVYPHTNVLKNLADIREQDTLSLMEAEYTSLRLAELVIQDDASVFDFNALCDMHYYIFQDMYEWAGKIRVINIEKEEPVLGGISIEYSDCFDIERDLIAILKDMNGYPWHEKDLKEAGLTFSEFLARIWKVHPYREGNTRTVITFCCQFIESKGFYILSELFKENAQYTRSALVAANAIFLDLGDKRKTEYLDNIVLDAMEQGYEMKARVMEEINKAGFDASEETIKKIVFWNRAEKYEHTADEIREYLR